MSTGVKKVRRSGRDLAFTISELMDSKRLEIAVEMFQRGEPLMLKAIFTELGIEAQNVAKYSIIKKVNNMYGMPMRDLKPYLSRFNEFNTYNLWWSMTPVEQEYYLAKINGSTDEELDKLLEKVKKKFNME